MAVGAIDVEVVVRDAGLPLGDQRYAGEGLIDLEQADVIDAGADGLQGLAGSVQDGGQLQPGQVDRGRDDSHVPKRGRHADLHRCTVV